MCTIPFKEHYIHIGMQDKTPVYKKACGQNAGQIARLDKTLVSFRTW